MDVDAFAQALLAGQPTFPRYFARMRPLNQAGPPLLGGEVPEIEPLAGDGLESALGRGGVLVDARSAEAHAVARVPGRCRSRPGRRSGPGSAGSWTPIARSSSSSTTPDDLDDARPPGAAHRPRGDPRLRRRRLRGVAAAGPRGRGRPALDVDALAAPAGGGCAQAPFVIDVRQAAEYEAGHVPGAIHIGAGELPERLEELPRDRPIATVCASGYRSSVAASMLRARGFDRVSRSAAASRLGGARVPRRRTAASRWRPRGRSRPARTRVTRTRRHRRLEAAQPTRTPNAPSAATPSRTASSDDHDADRRPRQHVRRPARSGARP